MPYFCCDRSAVTVLGVLPEMRGCTLRQGCYTSPTMKLLIASITQKETIGIMNERAKTSQAHQLVDNPADADLILMLGNDARQPEILLDHPLYRAFPDRCAVYTEEDSYLPLVPGVYCSARSDQNTRIGRVFNYSYITRNGRHCNAFLRESCGGSQSTSPSEKKYLFSFQGGSTSLLRKRLFKLDLGRPDVLIENTATYRHWDNSDPDRSDFQRLYAQTLRQSHFVLCPRGAGFGSIRLFEVMAEGVAPVLLSDKYALPPGVDWDSFLLRFPESQIHHLAELLTPHLPSAQQRGDRARAEFEKAFRIDLEFDHIVELAKRSLSHRPPTEQVFRNKQRSRAFRFKLRYNLRRRLRTVAKGVLHFLS
jgi:hypothetical protein